MECMGAIFVDSVDFFNFSAELMFMALVWDVYEDILKVLWAFCGNFYIDIKVSFSWVL